MPRSTENQQERTRPGSGTTIFRTAAIATLVCLAASFAGIATTMAAEDADKAASKQLIRQGNAALDKGRFDDALADFEQAYQRFPSPKILFNQGQALQGLERNLDALLAYRRFLEEAKDAAPGVQAEARQQISNLTAKIGRLDVRCNRQGALVRVDGAERGSTPLAEPLLVTPGQHTVTLDWQGERKSAALGVSAGRVTAHEVAFAPRPGKLQITGNRDGAVVRIDGKEIGKTPLAEPPSLPPGEHMVSVDWQGESRSQAVSVSEGQTTSVSVTFAGESPVVVLNTLPPPGRPSPPWYRAHWAWVVGGAVVAAAATTAVLLWGTPEHYPDATLGKQAIGN